MATIYRFIVEQKTSSGGDGRKGGEGSSKSASKKGRNVSLFGGKKGGVEHNRKMRAINPLLNKLTGGWWEKGMRLGRAGAGLITKNTETGKLGVSGTSIAILVAFLIQTLIKWQAKERQKAEQLNSQNFKALENGIGSIRGEYDLNVSLWSGRLTYNQNK